MSRTAVVGLLTRGVLAVGVLSIGACGSAPTSSAPRSPARQVQALMRALDRGDCAAVKRLVVTPSAITCDEVAATKGSFADEGHDLADATFHESSHTSTSATVRIDWGNADPDESYDLDRIDGVWKVDFESAA